VAISADSDPRERGTQTQSVARSIALLRCFLGAEAGLTLSELARRTDLNVSTSYRLLQTLCAGGMLEREGDSERYVVGPVFVALARSAFVAAGMGDARDILRSLVASTHESASLGVADDGFVVVILREESGELLKFDRPPGARVPLYLSAMGKALLAFGPEPISTAVRALGPLAVATPRTLTSARALERDLKASVARGFTLVDEEQFPGVRSIGAPVFGADGALRAAVAVQGPTVRITNDRLESLGAAVRDAATALSALPGLGRLTSVVSGNGTEA